MNSDAGRPPNPSIRRSRYFQVRLAPESWPISESYKAEKGSGAKTPSAREAWVGRGFTRSWILAASIRPDGWVIDGCPVNGPSADSFGEEVAVAWFSGANDAQEVRAAFSSDGGLTFGPTVTVAGPSTTARPIGRAEVLFEAHRSAVVVWLSAEGEDARLRVRRVASDGRMGESVGVAESSSGRATGFPRLARVGGRIVLAWTATDSGNRAVVFDSEAISSLPGIRGERPAPLPSTPPTRLPAFSLVDLEGKSVTAKSLSGIPVLLNVWATWRGPCREELGTLAKLSEEFPSLSVLAFSVDGPSAGTAVRKLVQSRAPGLRVLHPDRSGLAGSLSVAALPRTFLFDAQGILVWSSTGAIKGDDPTLRSAIAQVSDSMPTKK